MKKLSELLKPDDRMKLIVSASVTGVILVLALLLPLAFRALPPEQTAEETGVEEKVRLFKDYWDDGKTLGAQPAVPSGGMIQFCEAQMRTLVTRCVDDRALDYTAPTGSEYTVLTGENGAEITLCRMWLEKRGDWQNWLDVCFDAESGDIYYLYLSRECLRNPALYQDIANGEGKAEFTARLLAEESGCELRWFSEEENGRGIAVLSSERGVLCYEISCACYDALIDIKINCS